EAQRLAAELDVDDGARDEGADQLAALAEHLDQLAHAGAHDRGERRLAPGVGLGEPLEPHALLAEEALLERAQELVLVADARVEAADRRAGAAGDLGHRDLGEPVLLDQRLGRVEQAVERALAARLFGSRNGLESREGGGLAHGTSSNEANPNPNCFLISLPRSRGQVPGRLGARCGDGKGGPGPSPPSAWPCSRSSGASRRSSAARSGSTCASPPKRSGGPVDWASSGRPRRATTTSIRRSPTPRPGSRRTAPRRRSGCACPRRSRVSPRSASWPPSARCSSSAGRASSPPS